jgi:hypothetical protein
MASYYPSRQAFFIRSLVETRPIFQGDIFRAVPSLHAAHPAVVESDFSAEILSPGVQLPLPTYEQAKSSIVLQGGFSMILPNPCEFSEDEKGVNHRERILAQLRPIREASNQRVVRQGTGALSTFWLPFWDDVDNPERDLFVSFRRVSTVDVAYVSRSRRVAALSRAAWIILIQRLSAYFGGVSLSPETIALQVAHLYPEDNEPS